MAPTLAAQVAPPSLACPACRGALANPCEDCGRGFPTVAGMRDMRLWPDRYLSLADERDKAERLAAMAEGLDLPALARAYYAMTDDVDPGRAARFLAHILGAEARGRRLAQLLPPSGRVLEVGCGTGGLLVAADRRGIDIQGIDVAARWLVLARKRLESRGLDVPLTLANAERLPWPDASFRAVVADSVVEHLDDPRAALAEWLRVVEPGGRLILWSPNRYSLLPDPHVGLWGLGFLPRIWQETYVKHRRGCDWTLRPLGSEEAKRMVQEAGWKGVRAEAAPGPTNHPAAVAYDRSRTLPVVRRLLRCVGPLWQVVAEKGAA